MKYIEKIVAPQFFIDDVRGLTLWKDYLAEKKRRLKEHILGCEQFGLCCYCEKKVAIQNSHIEHIKPKSLDIANLTFDYQNLLVSCNGMHFDEIGEKRESEHCGKFKDDSFDENLFLDPTKVINIANYFKFSADGVISASLLDKSKADYTLFLLNLNGYNNRLAEARKIAKKAFINNLRRFTIEEQREKIKSYISKNDTEFVTFFRYLYNP